MNRAAIYCRLSKEDGNEASQSIQAQRDILTQYVREQQWALVGTYIDDGYSGTNFERPDFQRLLVDVVGGKIDILVTKDLSRLGRNYLQTGYYLEEFFPANQVRYIALNDNVDTAQEDAIEFAPFKNIINEWYAKDISKKIRFTLDSKARRGEPRNTVFPLFGYAYNAAYERVPDATTAPIVQFIFQEFLRCGSAEQVARTLTARGIKVPQWHNALRYGYNKNKVLHLPEARWTAWTGSSVRDILHQREYLGTYITAKSKSISYKNKRRVANVNRFEFPQRYPALIEPETFARAQALLNRGRAARVSVTENPFAGLVFCAACGRAMKFERKGTYARYYCHNAQCPGHNTIRRELLVQLVTRELECLMPFLQNLPDSYTAPVTDTTANMAATRQQYQQRLTQIQNYLQQLFEQHANGLLPEAVYQDLLATYTREQTLVNEQLETVNKVSPAAPVSFDLTPNITRLAAAWRACIVGVDVQALRSKAKTKRYHYAINVRYAALDAALAGFARAGCHLC